MLHIAQTTINAIDGVQFVMRTAFDDFAMFHHQYEICMADCGETVRYRENRAILHEIGKRILHKTFRNRIKRTRGLIKD
jgi:predicted MarR family transcription regulator